MSICLASNLPTSGRASGRGGRPLSDCLTVACAYDFSLDTNAVEGNKKGRKKASLEWHLDKGSWDRIDLSVWIPVWDSVAESSANSRMEHWVAYGSAGSWVRLKRFECTSMKLLPARKGFFPHSYTRVNEQDK